MMEQVQEKEKDLAEDLASVSTEVSELDMDALRRELHGSMRALEEGIETLRTDVYEDLDQVTDGVDKTVARWNAAWEEMKGSLLDCGAVAGELRHDLEDLVEEVRLSAPSLGSTACVSPRGCDPRDPSPRGLA